MISAVERHKQAPSTFELPSEHIRQTLKPGQGAKLLFEIEIEMEDGRPERSVERMWVVITEVLENGYIGRLTNSPSSFEESSDFYLKEGAEIPFLPEHVASLSNPPESFLAELASSKPCEVWPRD